MTALRSADLYGIPECKAMIDNVLKEFDARDPDDAPLLLLASGIQSCTMNVNQVSGLPCKNFPRCLIGTACLCQTVL